MSTYVIKQLGLKRYRKSRQALSYTIEKQDTYEETGTSLRRQNLKGNGSSGSYTYPTIARVCLLPRPPVRRLPRAATLRSAISPKSASSMADASNDRLSFSLESKNPPPLDHIHAPINYQNNRRAFISRIFQLEKIIQIEILRRFPVTSSTVAFLFPVGYARRFVVACCVLFALPRNVRSAHIRIVSSLRMRLTSFEPIVCVPAPPLYTQYARMYGLRIKSLLWTAIETPDVMDRLRFPSMAIDLSRIRDSE